MIKFNILRYQTVNYDALGRPTTAKYCLLGTNQITTTAQSCESIEYKYEGAHLSQIIDPNQTTQYTYDTQGRPTIESVQFKDSQKQWQTEYQYDDKGRIDKVDLPEGATLSYIYNDTSSPVEVKYQAPVQSWWQKLVRSINNDYNSISLISDMQADSAHGLLGFTHSNGQTAKADYDKVEKLTTWTDGDYQKRLTYDAADQIIATSSQQGDKENSQQLSYNAYGELISVNDTEEDQTAQYQYDLNSNRTGFSSSETQAKYEYKVGTDQLLSVSSQVNSTSNSNSGDSNNNSSRRSNYTYDAVGNPTSIITQNSNSKTQRQFTYGARGQLTQIIDDNQTTDYRYNHAMQRVSKTIANDEQRYLWQQGLLDAEIDSKDNQETVTRRYIYIGLRPIAMIDYDQDNTPSIYTIHTDHLGTPQQVSNEAQEVVWQGDYDAFGQVTVKAVSKNNKTEMQAKQKDWLPTLMNSANAVESVTSSPFEFNLRFAGQYEDSESGYYYNWHRYYNPETGRYLTSDPIGLNGGLNTYGYAGANPISFVDPWGLYSISEGGLTHFFTGFKLLKNFSIPTPPGWVDYKTDDEIGYYDLYHTYNIKHTEKGLTVKQQQEIQEYIIDHPTPNSKVKPATRRQLGTYQSASPDKGPFQLRSWIGGIKPTWPIIDSQYKEDYVYSFIRTGTNGRDYIIGVFQPQPWQC